MKTVNSEANSIHRVAYNVIVKIKSWLRNDNFLVVLMDDFNIILGMKLLYKMKIVSIPYLGTIAILDDKALCIVLVHATKMIRR